LIRKRIVVTGGAGFIGGHMVDRLIDEGHHVVVVDNLSTGALENVNRAAELVQGDVAEPQIMDSVFRKGADVVFHIAGQASTIRSFTAPEEDLRVNTLGTVNVVMKALEYRVPRLLFASSMMVYGHPRLIPTPESEPCKPVSYYGITKYAAERYVSATAERRDLGFEFSVTSFRMFNVYGERQSLTNPYQGVAAIFIGNVLRGEPITIHGDGQQSRDFVHIRDVVEAWMLALDSRAAYGQVFNLGAGVSHSINEVADVTLAALGGSRGSYPVVYAPPRPVDLRIATADIAHSGKILGWKPRVSFREGMAEIVRWGAQTARTGGGLRGTE